MMHRSLLASALLAAALPAAADGGWTGSGELGLVVARGNSETETLNARLQGVHETQRWRHTLGVAGLYAKDSGTTSAQRYVLNGKSDYKFSERSYMFTALRYEDDRFSGFDYQASLSMGAGKRFFDTETRFLSAEAGPGFRRAERRSGEVESDLIGRGQLEYRQRLTETTEFTNRLLVETGKDNTFGENEAGVAVRVNESLALRFGLALRHNSDVPEGSKRTDTLTTVNLVYAF